MYPPTSPKKKGEVALLLIPSSLLIGAIIGRVSRSTAPHSAAISDVTMRGNREGMSSVEHSFSEPKTDACVRVGFLSKRANKKTDAIKEKVFEKEGTFLLFIINFLF